MAQNMQMHEVLRSLKGCLKLLGLIPSRVYIYMNMQADSDCQHREMYPGVDHMRSVVKCERHDNLDVAVMQFIELLLNADEEHFESVMNSFMKALLDSNSDHQEPDANPDLWRVHDVIKLACTYLPLQQSLQSFFSEDQGHQLNLESAVKDLTDQQGVILPEHVPHVFETAEEEGLTAAAVRLLSFVYAAQVNRLMGDYNNSLNEQVHAGRTQWPGGEEQLQWLKIFVDSIERNGGAGFSNTVSESLFSTDKWEAVYDQLCYGGLNLALRDTDDGSEAGESVASDATVMNSVDEPGLDREEDNFGASRVPARQIISINPGNKTGYRKEKDFVTNLDKENPQDRTKAYVINHCNHKFLPMNVVEVFDHNYIQPSEMCAAAWLLTDEDDTSSKYSMSSGTTDNNSILNSGLWGTRHSRSIALADGQIVLRDYQLELLHLVREGKNVAIFLPTGTGKTFIIIKYVQEHLSKPGLNRVMFLAPKVKLAEQQFHRFRDFFPEATYFRCGKSRSSLAPFSELLDVFKVFVLTPQCLVEALERKEVKMTDFSLLVLDECHHLGRGKHAYKALMNLYMDAKFDETRNNASLPQVIGLTASPGIGTSGTLTSAATYIRQLCYSMDTENICTVIKHKQELERFVNEPKHEIHTCQKRKRDGFKQIIEKLMKVIEDLMLDSPCVERFWTQEQKDRLSKILTAPNLHRGKLVYFQWLTSLENKLVEISEYKATYQKLFSMVEMLVVYQKSLMLNEDCQSEYALDYLQEEIRNLGDQRNNTEMDLVDLFYDHLNKLQQACKDPEDFNPKLVMLEDILMAILEENQDQCACMVFVRTLELTKALQKWIQTHSVLAQLNPGRLTGSHRLNVGGMTRQELSDVMQKFNIGEHKLVVCTSAAEEGLDFQACNVVVRYDYVTSMISMIQTRGRARRMDSQYCVVGAVSHGNINKERENVASEKLMKEAVRIVQEDIEVNQNSHLVSMRQCQKRDWEMRQYAKSLALEKRKVREVTSVPYQLLCRKCQVPACMSTDFRLLEQSSRAVISRSFKWQEKKTKEPYQFKHDLVKIAKVHCHKCSYDWGIMVQYTPTGCQLPVLKIESFFLVDSRNNERLLKKFKWSEVPFEVPEINEAELSINT